LGRDERHAGVEADVSGAGDQRVVGETGVGAGIGDDEEFAAGNGVCAEGDIARGLLLVHADSRFEPLAVGVNQGDGGDGGGGDVGGEAGEVVEFLLRRGVEDAVLREDFEALGLVGERRWLRRRHVCFSGGGGIRAGGGPTSYSHPRGGRIGGGR